MGTLKDAQHTTQQGNANQNYNEIFSHSLLEWLLLKRQTITNAEKDAQKSELFHTAGRNVNCYKQYGNSMEVPGKIKNRPTTI